MATLIMKFSDGSADIIIEDLIIDGDDNPNKVVTVIDPYPIGISSDFEYVDDHLKNDKIQDEIL